MAWPPVELGDDELCVIVGPTGSGKTELAVHLAERLGGEVIGADSVQVYRHFDRGSGKPTQDQLDRAPHHLLDVADPLEPMDATRFALAAEEALEAIRARGRVPIVCGGTFLWIKALLYGLAPTAPADAGIRARHAALVDAEGRPALHARLAAIDPVSAARLAPNDVVRVSRALEVHELTGKPLSAWHEDHRFATPRHRARFLGVRRGPDELTQRIERRTQAWLAERWVDEVAELVRRGYRGARAMGSVGYREVLLHVEGGLAASELATRIVRATRVFARRQRTWLRELPVTWLDPGP